MKKKVKQRLEKLEQQLQNTIRLKNRSWKMYEKYEQKESRIENLMQKLNKS